MFFSNMVSLITIFGLLGNITTGLVYLAPAKTFWYIMQRRSTEEFDCLPYVVKLLNGYMWVYYGIVKPNSILVATINGFGAVLELVYVTIFLIFAPPRTRAITATLFGVLDVVFPIGAVLVTQIFYRECNISIFCFSVDYEVQKTVVRTKSVEYMPFLLSFILFINGLTWTVYALLTNDWFIGSVHLMSIPILIYLYAIYWKPKQSKTTSDHVDDGWQHESLMLNN
ncbi:hypothetical protein ERO13_A11G268850v2 [Gossypium hirsutum]|nr:hypothetical protein ERO13_A11G268850v2 [Gossypium hirsutum]